MKLFKLCVLTLVVLAAAGCSKQGVTITPFQRAFASAPKKIQFTVDHKLNDIEILEDTEASEITKEFKDGLIYLTGDWFSFVASPRSYNITLYVGNNESEKRRHLIFSVKCNSGTTRAVVIQGGKGEDI